ASAAIYKGCSPPLAATLACFLSITSSFCRRPIQTRRASYLRIRYSLNTSPSPPAPPITTYTPPCRYAYCFLSVRLAPLSSNSHSTKRRRSPCHSRQPQPPPPSSQPSRFISAQAQSSPAISTRRTFQFRYSFAIEPINPCTLLCAASVFSFRLAPIFCVSFVT